MPKKIQKGYMTFVLAFIILNQRTCCVYQGKTINDLKKDLDLIVLKAFYVLCIY